MTDLYRDLYRIRRFEEKVLENFPKGIFFGTTHTYIGQEANAVGVLMHLLKNDIVFSNHRCHGHFIAYGGDIRSLFAELMGKSTGVCGGWGGSQHLHWKNFYSNGIQGGIVPVATGMALGEKYLEKNSVTVVFLGDGTMGEGVVYESLNIASLWSAPILFVLENNKIAQTTPINLALSGTLCARFTAFDIKCEEINTSDVDVISRTSETIIKAVREKNKPRALIIHTNRFSPHSKGDDTRDPDQVELLREKYDPIKIYGSKISPTVRSKIESEVNKEINIAFESARKDPMPRFDKSSIAQVT